ncbi:PREDICTED: cytochrome c oxidase subunit 4 isoform 1, mitochondrial-like [Amphimedon queenslandica]|uniref:Uncharacterized protein n=1 Tax=Amphimedon queenslandica TaxID=400682 RepID=A0A1X7TPI2_AMPQE|nr:PREDICTED: cytochrome c oxidase subunit 4 isoform 1, mitochondrial-like [Amphimedon queenslandica]XP_011409210.1 PREDICTED: cytochrome c oxidase subunit 4 isoform 1, mitochondrial-like [Amphimedon queenslandica]|eukprot:XP_003390084.1 PREDICTED: cytochrome c oxidase subunit 4 isoform 1, mitochondrial-like [Amphimedon queenslandica]
MATLFIARRFLSSSVPRLHLTISVARPAPLSLQMNLSTPELKAAYDKSCGHWSKLSKEETVMLYRATFPQSFKELKDAEKGYGPKVFAGTTLAIIIGVILAEFFKRTIGPEVPHTLDNPQWEEDTRKKLIRQKANPIEGISSRVN